MRANVDVAHAQEQRGDAASAGYGRTGGTSSSRCKCSWPRTNTTPPKGDKARPEAGRRYEQPLLQPELFQLYEEELGGSRPPCLGEPRRPQDRDQLRTVGQTVGFAPMVQILDAPVAQMVEQVPNLTQFFDTLRPDPGQVIEVPKILLVDVPMRTPVRDTQLAEQLVEVPTIVLIPCCSGLWSRTSTFQLLVVRGETLVFKVSP